MTWGSQIDSDDSTATVRLPTEIAFAFGQIPPRL